MEKRKVFVQIPNNNPAGGIKVANQLVNLFREHNYESYIVLPQRMYQANWLIKPAPVINIARMKKLCEESDIVIDNWPDKRTMCVNLDIKAKTKIFYLQGCTFPRGYNLIGDEFLKQDFGYTAFWVVSNDSLNYLKQKYPRIKKWHLVNPYFEFDEINRIKAITKRENKILCLNRKGKKYIKLSKIIFGSRIKFEVINKKFSEREFYQKAASSKFFLSTAVGIENHYLKQLSKIILNYFSKTKRYIPVTYIIPPGHKEGFPLPPAEAALCGSIVIGFAMGGGLEWMSPKNCFLAKDRSYFSLIKKIKEALSTADKKLEEIKRNALLAVSKFNKKNTWRQIEVFLKRALFK